MKFKQVASNKTQGEKVVASLLIFLFMLVGNISMSYGHNVRDIPGKHDDNSLRFVIYLEGATIEDTLRISFVHVYGETRDDQSYQRSMNKNGYFEFNLSPKENQGYIKIEKRRKYVLDNTPNMYDKIAPFYNWRIRDSIRLSVFLKSPTRNYDNSLHKRYKYSFGGRGAIKYWLANQIDSIISSTSELGMPIIDNYFNYHEPHAVGMGIANNLLDKYKSAVSLEDYYNLKLRILSSNSRSKFNHIKNYFNEIQATDRNDKLNAFKTSLSAFENENLLNSIPSANLSKSLEYISYTLRSLEAYCSIIYDSNYAEKLYSLIKKRYLGSTRDNLIVAYFLQARFSMRSSELYMDALKIVKELDCVEFLRKEFIKSRGLYGHNFVLSDSSGRKIAIDDFKGKILLFDFWYTGCGACSSYYEKTLRFAEKYFEQDSIVRFISVSVDVRKDHWLDGLKSGKYTSDLAFSVYTNGNGIDCDFMKFYNIVDLPTVMVVDKDGVVRAFNSLDLYDYDKLIKLLEKVSNQ